MFPKTKMIMHKANVSLNGLNKSTLTWRCTIAWRFSHFECVFLPLCRRFVLYFLVVGLTTKSTARCSAILWDRLQVYHCYDFALTKTTLHYVCCLPPTWKNFIFLNWTFFGTIILIFFSLVLSISLSFYTMFFYNSLNKYVV